MVKEKKLNILCSIVVVGFGIAVLFHYLMGVYFKLDYPYNTFLFRSDDRFNDFFNPLRGSYDRDPYNPARINFIGGYFPFGYMVSFLVSLIQPWVVAFFIFIIGFIAYLAVYLRSYVYPDVSIINIRNSW